MVHPTSREFAFFGWPSCEASVLSELPVLFLALLRKTRWTDSRQHIVLTELPLNELGERPRPA
jgi:hypothetical protein